MYPKHIEKSTRLMVAKNILNLTENAYNEKDRLLKMICTPIQ